MIVDARTYTVAAGKMAGFLDTYANNGLPLQRKHGFDLAGYFTVETGPLNQVVHYWKWDSAAHRQECRRALYNDPEWTEYRKTNSEGVIVKQFNRLLAATDVVEPFAFMGNGSELGFVDERTYTLNYATVPAYVEVTKKMASPLIQAAGWQLVGYFYSITGTINDVVHLWYWDSQAQREELQAKVTSDPAWPIYQAANGHRIQKQENRYLVPTDFSPLK
ncbi:MAG: NIPSNAP family protein [Alphaproteobacteria bacterium]|nr:NIPSNAP family protein [Alphaproteobacteria bacterium]